MLALGVLVKNALPIVFPFSIQAIARNLSGAMGISLGN